MAENKAFKLAGNDDVKMAVDNDVKMAVDNDVEMAEGNDVKMVEDNDVKLAEEEDVKLAEDNEVKMSEDNDVKMAEDKEIKLAENNDGKMAEDNDVKMADTKAKEVVISTEEEEATAENDEEGPSFWKELVPDRKLILLCLGYAAGYCNLWRFPYLCYKHEGAAFVISYLAMMVAAGIPMTFLNMALGQYASSGPTALYANITPIFTGLGWSMIVTVVLVPIFYNHVMAWSLLYTYFSFSSVLPWSNCDNDFNSENCVTYKKINECKNETLNNDNETLYYYNGTCLTLDEYCSISSLKSFNETFCIGGENDTDIMAADEAVVRISASEDFYLNRLHQVNGRTWEELGGMNWEMVICLAIAWVLICAFMIKGTKNIKISLYYFAVIPYVFLFILLIRGATLEGAYDGIHFYILSMNITNLQSPQVWHDAISQVFFSLGIGFGALITLSSYNKFKHNCMRDAIGISITNLLTSFFGGFVIFTTLGFIAHENGVPVKGVVDSESGLAFIVYSTAVAQMPFPPLWSVLFFVIFASLGIISQFAFIETLVRGLTDIFTPLSKRRSVLIISVASVYFLLGLPICLKGGVYMFELMNVYTVGLSLLFIAFCEVVIGGYLYGFNRIIKNLKVDMAIPVHQFFCDYWSITWLCFSPISIIALFGEGIYYYQPAAFGSYIFPENIQGIGWALTAVPIVPIVIGALYAINEKKKRELITPTRQFGAAHKKDENNTTPQLNYVLDNQAFEPDSKETIHHSTEDDEEDDLDSEFSEDSGFKAAPNKATIEPANRV